MAMVGYRIRRGRSGNSHLHGDIFPALGGFVSIGAAIGLAGALALARLEPSSRQDLLRQSGLGAAVGAIVGLFIGLGRAAWRPGVPLPAPVPATEPVVQLWDPWLDSGREEGWGEPEAVMGEPALASGEIGQLAVSRARVRPRVISRATGEAVLLEDEVGSLIQAGASGFIQIVGGPGSGKTTALEHLAAVLPPWARERVRLLDEYDTTVDSADRDLTVTAALEFSQPNPLAVYGLAPWRQDDLIEYLLAVHRERCASVMARLRRSGDASFLRGIPELWTTVLDLMAATESIADARSALRHELAGRLRDRRLKGQVEKLSLAAIHQLSKVAALGAPDAPVDEMAQIPFDPELFRLIRHRPVMLLLAASRLTQLAEHGQDDAAFRCQLHREVIGEAALLLSGNTPALQNLGEWIERSRFRSIQPTVASLLHATMPEWRPERLSRPHLAGAYLDGVKWAGVNLEGVDLQSADLEAADLCGANLERADVRRACFRRADLRGAYLTRLRAENANFGGADLRWAKMKQVILSRADLADVALIEADLSQADLRKANIDRADFSGATLEAACLTGLDLRTAQFEGARFGGADLRFCNLEEMQLTAPDFHGAQLLSTLLTGSRMPAANFVGADLRNAGLANIDWPDANLRNADLRGANFHLGSVRDGLVGSLIACEGSRTGFYTDDYNDQNVKPIEEIRKANLQGADLRGARIEDVDFYLVDLRQTKYTADQAEHFRRCRALLKDPAGP